MNWLNIETTTLDSEEFVGSDPVTRATWLCLLRFCAGQENGGVIASCREWPDRKWQQLARVTKEEVLTESALWTWDGDTLRLWSYPSEKETEVQHRRERAKTNGRLGGRPSSKPTLETNAKPTSVHFAKAEGEGEGEGEGKEKGRKADVADGSATNDADWLKELSAKPAYQGIDVAREHGKMQAWCAANRKQPTRRRFVNWLNRVEKPLATAPGVIIDDFRGTTYR